jgi:high-affinity Fe2+/Pb2+ permease
MKETNAFSNLSDEKLLKRRDLMKGVLIGFGILFLVIIFVMIFLFRNFNSNKITLVPVFLLPVTFLPLLITYNLINKEVKSRNLK